MQLIDYKADKTGKTELKRHRGGFPREKSINLWLIEIFHQINLGGTCTGHHQGHGLYFYQITATGDEEDVAAAAEYSRTVKGRGASRKDAASPGAATPRSLHSATTA